MIINVEYKGQQLPKLGEAPFEPITKETKIGTIKANIGHLIGEPAEEIIMMNYGSIVRETNSDRSEPTVATLYLYDHYRMVVSLKRDNITLKI